MKIFCKELNKEKTITHPIPVYDMNGILMGYEESDETFKKRIKKELEKDE